jgi:hypothetical protein
MFFNAKTVGGFREFLNNKVNLHSSLVALMAEAIEKDAAYHTEHGVPTFANQVHFLSWRAIDLPVTAVAANESALILHRMKAMSGEAPLPESIKTSALEHVCQEMQISDRSTSGASNLVEDAKRAFWIEVAGLVLRA